MEWMAEAVPDCEQVLQKVLTHSAWNYRAVMDQVVRSVPAVRKSSAPVHTPMRTAIKHAASGGVAAAASQPRGDDHTWREFQLTTRARTPPWTRRAQCAGTCPLPRHCAVRSRAR